MLYAGLDLGQKRDHSAIVVVERMNLYQASEAPAFHGVDVRHVERAPLGTPYPEVVAGVRDLVRRLARQYDGCALAVDATGVGAPVVEMLRAAGLGAEVTAVTITGGDRERVSGGVWSVPKRDLMAGVQVMLEKRTLRIGRRMKEAGALVKELTDVRLTAGSGGMGAEGRGEHDDLAVALALACWRARRATAGPMGRRLPGI